jgi:hypothetical protein
MMLQAKAAFGDDDDSLSDTGLCSDFYVFKWVLTVGSPTRKLLVSSLTSALRAQPENLKTTPSSSMG